jgi:hypothetical protein
MANTFTVSTYSPTDVILNIGGYQVAGWMSIGITRNSRGYTVVKGIRGKNTRVRNQDTSATILVTLMASSQTNDVFSYIHELDMEEGTGRISLTLKDLSGSSVFSTSEAYITGYPAVSKTGQIENTVWEIFAQTTEDFFVGGNARPSTNMFDSAVSEASDFISNLF